MTQFDILLRQGLMEANLERSELLAAPRIGRSGGPGPHPAGGESPGASPRPLRSSFSSQRLRQSPSLCGSPTSAG